MWLYRVKIPGILKEYNNTTPATFKMQYCNYTVLVRWMKLCRHEHTHTVVNNVIRCKIIVKRSAKIQFTSKGAFIFVYKLP